MKMSFHGNQIGHKVSMLLLKTFQWHPKWNKMELFWRILSVTTGFYTKKLVRDNLFTIFHKSINISLDIGLRILNPLTPEHLFPLAGELISRNPNTFMYVLCEICYVRKTLMSSKCQHLKYLSSEILVSACTSFLNSTYRTRHLYLYVVIQV